MKFKTARELVTASDNGKLTDKELLDAIASLSMHEKDLLVPCKSCDAKEGEECVHVDRRKRTCKMCFKTFAECVCHAGPYVQKGKNLVSLRGSDKSKIIKPGVVHIGRRINRLLKGIR